MPGIRQALDRLRGVRHIEWALLALALAAALLVGGSREAESPAASSLERRMEAVLSCVRGAGEVRVLVNRTEEAAAFSGADSGENAPVTGVLVVAAGAEDLRVRLELQQAVQALLGVEAEQIEILSMKEENS